MASPVRINFRVGGVQEVVNAFKTVAKATRDAEKQVEILSSRRERATRKQVTDVQKSEEKIRKEQERTADKAIKEIQRELKERYKLRTQREKEANRIARVEENAAKRTADRQISEAKRVAAAQEREAKKAYAVQERAAKRAHDVQSRESARAAAAKASQEQYLIRLRQRHYMTEQRSEEKAVKLQEAKARVAERQRLDRARDRAGTIVGSVGGLLSGAVTMAGTALTLGGGFTVADAISEDVKARGQAKALELMSGGDAKAGDILNASKSAGVNFGVATTDVVDALDQFAQKSGKVKDGLSILKDLIEIATATGADVGELSKTAGIVHMTTGNAQDTLSVVREMAGMGRAGSVDLRDLQQYGGRVTSAASLYENKRAAITGLNAIVQQSAATGGSTDAAEATMSVVRLGSDLLKKEDMLKSDYGMNIRGTGGKLLRDPTELIKELVVKTGGDMGKLHEILGERSFRAASGYAAVYNEATKGKTGEFAKSAGIAAMDSQFKVFTSAVLTESQVKQDAAARMKESDMQLKVVLQQLRYEVGERLTPKFIELVPHLTQLVPAVASMTDAAVAFIDFMRENPFSGLGAVISGKIMADLSGAALGKVAERALTASFASGIGTIAIAGMAATIGMATIDILSQKDKIAQRREAISAMTSGQLPTDVAERIKAGKATAEDAALIESQRNEVSSKMASLQKQATKPSMLSTIVGLVSDEGKDAVNTQFNAELREVEEYKMGLAELGRAAADVAKQLRESQPNRSKPFAAGN